MKHTDFSIWECSDTCGCPPECMNRVRLSTRKRDDAEGFVRSSSTVAVQTQSWNCSRLYVVSLFHGIPLTLHVLQELKGWGVFSKRRSALRRT